MTDYKTHMADLEAQAQDLIDDGETTMPIPPKAVLALINMIRARDNVLENLDDALEVE